MGLVIHGYHGSKEVFDTFSFEKMGTNGGEENNNILNGGAGLYFTTSKAEAIAYGDNLYSVILTLKSPISCSERTLTDYHIEMLIDKIDQLTNYEHDLIEKQLRIPGDTDKEIIDNIIDLQVPVSAVMAALTNYGYTHTEDCDSPDDPSMPHYIVYDLNAIQIIKVENLNEI